MRCQPRLVRIRIETLDQRNLIWPLTSKIIPTVSIVIFDTKCRSFIVLVDETRGDEVVLIINGEIIGDRKGVVGDGVLDRSPDIDNTDSRFEEALCICTEVTSDTIDASFPGLVDMDALLQVLY